MTARQLVRTTLVTLAWTVAGYLAFLNLQAYVPHGLGYDTHAYWLAGRSAHPYAHAVPGDRDAFLYSPAFALAMRPLAVVPFGVFYGAWLALEAAALCWLTWPLPVRWRVPVLLMCVPELIFGNVYGFLGVAAALGVRRAGFWAFPALTKVSSGAAGFVWFLVRRDRAALLWASAWTAGLAVLSAVLAPGLWHSYVDFLLHGQDDEPWWLRLLRFALGLAVAVWGARTRRAWTVPVAMLLLAPHLGLKLKDVAMLAAIPRVVRNAPTLDP
ncbi:DUF2029 domain-containing protein [Nocardioides mangrovicus]|uniref:DUF2029 domain-containing protein n=1 Tax=Nocardioides mangrovicus TaxID=2478913 RepID=A0A3L8P5Z1_9ACTN|nr:glycosyltransferase 87 family protein [Nocardioides mangrovicus]RLV50621.1 DUF2029 domain-containing protein [Nocardioides mangrovicus]